MMRSKKMFRQTREGDRVITTRRRAINYPIPAQLGVRWQICPGHHHVAAVLLEFATGSNFLQNFFGQSTANVEQWFPAAGAVGQFFVTANAKEMTVGTLIDRRVVRDAVADVAFDESFKLLE